MEQKRKLMLISPMLHQGGFERVCVTTARLLEPWFDVTIVIFNSANIAYDVEGLNIIDIQMGVVKGAFNKILNMFRRSRKVRQLKKEMQPEIAYSFGPTANLVNALSKTGKEKVWLGLRNYTDVEETSKIKLFVKKADLIVCCSKDIETAIQEKYHFHKTAVLYNLYDVNKIEADSKKSDPKLPFSADSNSDGKELRYILSMGRDDKQKGFWHMVKIFSLVHEKIPESRLVILGAGSYEKSRKLAEALGVEDAVHFAGMQRSPYVYLKKGEIYLMTSLNEGFPNALVEGMALGLAPVSVNCLTGPAEILLENSNTTSLEKRLIEMKNSGETPVVEGEYGIVLPAIGTQEDYEGPITEEEKIIAQTIIDLMSDPEKLARYRASAKRRAEDFSYEKYIEAFLALSE